MGIKYDAGGSVDRSSVSPARREHLRFTRGATEREDIKKANMRERANKYITVKPSQHQREAPDYMKLAKQRIGVEYATGEQTEPPGARSKSRNGQKE